MYNDSGQRKTGICGKLIQPGQIVYHCKDCSMDYAVFICVDCFEKAKGKHDGHDFEIVRNPEKVMCDCGDVEALKKTCFCSEHGGPVQQNDLQANFNEGKDAKFYKQIQKFFYYMCQGLEEAAKTDNKYIRMRISDMLYLIFFYLTKAIENQKSLSLPLGEALTSQINSPIKIGEEQPEDPFNKTILKYIFLTHKFMTKTCQRLLNNFFI